MIEAYVQSLLDVVAASPIVRASNVALDKRTPRWRFDALGDPIRRVAWKGAQVAEDLALNAYGKFIW